MSELKRGSLALTNENPVIAAALPERFIRKLKSNLQEVKARGGQMFFFEDENSGVESESGLKIIKATTNVG